MTNTEERLTETFKRALDNILARVFVSAPAHHVPSLAVAFSGGLDSSVLLYLAQQYAAERSIALHAFHIHHGLSTNADAWLAHCRSVCAQRGGAFDACRVQVFQAGGRGLEAAARSARYGALGELCRAHKVPLLLTAHHQDDQVETVLLQMLRGAGLAGLSGMDEMNAAPELLGDGATIMARPLLAVSRAELAEFAAAIGMVHIEDESNLNSHHPRNALRNDVLPLLATHFPTYRACLTRSAQHAQSAQRLLDELAAQDLAICLDGDALDALRVESLSDDRIANLMRYWLSTRGLRPPSTAWLNEALAQLLHVSAESQACVGLLGVELRRYRNRILIVRPHDLTNVAPVEFRWQGEASLPFPAFGGSLHFDVTESGCDPDWLSAQALRLQARTAGVGKKIKLAPNRSSRSLKEHFQALGIPAWERAGLPLVFVGKELLFAAGIGQDSRLSFVASGIQLRWQADHA